MIMMKGERMPGLWCSQDMAFIPCNSGSEYIQRFGQEGLREGRRDGFSRTGMPMDNAMIESFYGSFRDECLNVN